MKSLDYIKYCNHYGITPEALGLGLPVPGSKKLIYPDSMNSYFIHVARGPTPEEVAALYDELERCGHPKAFNRPAVRKTKAQRDEDRKAPRVKVDLSPLISLSRESGMSAKTLADLMELSPSYFSVRTGPITIKQSFLDKLVRFLKLQADEADVEEALDHALDLTPTVSRELRPRDYSELYQVLKEEKKIGEFSRDVKIPRARLNKYFKGAPVSQPVHERIIKVAEHYL